MSREIDEKVVEMRFDNRDFEKNVNTSLSTLDKLKEKLKFHGAEKGFEDLSSAAGNVNFGGMSSALDSVTAKFDTLQAVAVRVLSDIASSAVRAGADFVKSFTIDPIAEGWSRYGEKTKAIGTLTSQGFDQDEVYTLVEKLMWYADETSFSMNQMLRGMNDAIGAGSTLDEAATALMGITGIVAKGGKTGADANHLITQLGQAMGHPMTAQDWLSVSNLGLSTVELKQAFLDAAEALGTLVQVEEGVYRSIAPDSELKDDVMISNFAATLAKGRWATTDVQMAVYTKYASAVQAVYDRVQETGQIASEAAKELFDAGLIDEFGYTVFKSAQEARTWGDVLEATAEAVSTGWSTTFEHIFGKYEEATSLFTNLSETLYNVFAESGNVRNAILEDWNLLDGRLDLIAQGLSTEISQDSFISRLLDGKTMEEQTMIMQNYSDVLNQMIGYANEYGVSMAEAFDIFGDQLDAYGYQQFAAALELPRGALWNFVDALFAFDEESEQAIGIIEIIKQAYSDIFPPLTGERLKEITTNIREFTASLVPSAEKAEKLRSTFKGLFAILDIGKQVVSAVWRTISPIFGHFGKVSDILLDNTADLGERIASFAENLRENDTIYKTLQQGLGKIQELFGKVRVAIDPAIKKVQEWWRAAMDYLKIPEGSTIVTGIITMSETLRSKIETTMIPLLQTWWKAAKDYLHLPSKDEFIDWWKNFGTNVSNFLGPAIDKLKSWGRAFADHLKNIDWDSVKSSASSLASTIRDHLGAAFEKIRDMLPEIKEKLFAFGSAASETLSNVWKAIKENVFGENNEGFLNLMKGVAIGGIGISAGELIHNIAGPFKAAKEGITSFFDGLKKALKNLTDDGPGFTEMLRNVAVSIGILALAISILASQDVDNIIAAAGAMSILAAELSGAILILGKVTTNFTIMDAVMVFAVAAAFVKMAKAVNILSESIEALTKYGWEDLAKGIGGVTVALIAMGTALAIGKGKSAKGAKSVGFAFIEMAAAVWLIAQTVEQLGALSWDEIKKGVGSVVAILLAVGLAMMMIPKGNIEKTLEGTILGGKGTTRKTLSEAKTNAIAMGFAFIEIAAALEIIAHVIKKLGEMDIKILGQGFLAIGAALAAIVIAMRSMPSSLDMIGVGTGILEISIALGILYGVIKAFGTLATSNGGWVIIAGGLAAVGGAFLVIAGGLKLLQPFAGTLITLAGGFALAGAGMLAFGLGLLSVTTALAAFAAGGSLASLGFLGMVELIGLAVKAAVAAVLDLIPMIIEKLGDSLVSLLDVIQGLSGKIVETIIVLVRDSIEGIMVVAPEIAEALMVLLEQAMDWLIENGDRFVKKICDFIIVLMNALTEKTPELVQSLVTFAVTLFASLIDTLKDLGPDMILKASEGAALITMLMLACAGLSSIALPAIKGLALAGLFVVELGAIIAAIGGLASIPGAMDLVGKGGDMLMEIGSAIGKFFGGIAGGFAGGTIRAFCDEIVHVGPSVIESAERAAKLILTLTEASLLEGIRSFLFGDSDFSAFAEGLTELGPALRSFGDEMDGVNTDAVKNGADALMALVDFAEKVPERGGLWSKIVGENSMAGFAQELAILGPRLLLFSNSVADVDVERVKGVVPALIALTEFAEQVPERGGLWASIVGENSMAVFAQELAVLGPHLASFSTSIKTVNVSRVKGVVPALIALTEFAAQIPERGGVWAYLFGENTISQFAAELGLAGPHFASFSNSIKSVNYKRISALVPTLIELTNFASQIPERGGIWAYVFGENTISQFAAELAYAGPHLASFSNSTQTVNYKRVSAMIPMLIDLTNFAHQIPEKGGVFQWILGENSIAAFGEELATFGPHLADYSDALKDVSVEKIEASIPAVQALIGLAASLAADQGGKSLIGMAVEAVSKMFGQGGSFPFGDLISKLGLALSDFYANAKDVNYGVLEKAVVQLTRLAAVVNEIGDKDYSTASFTTALSNIGQAMVDAMVTGVSMKSESLYSKIQSIIDEVAVQAKREDSKFDAIGKEYIDHIGQGFNTQKAKLASDFALAVLAAINELNRKYNDFRDAGIKLAEGLSNGLVSKQSEVGDKAQSISSFAAGRMRDDYDEFFKVGEYLVQGLLNGMSSKKNAAVTASDDLIGTIESTMKQRAREHSPSKMTQEIGMYLGEGLIVGLRSTVPEVTATSVRVADASLSGLADAIFRMNEMVEEEVWQPVITPVMDLSTIMAQKDLVDDIFGGSRSYGIAQLANRSTNTFLDRKIQNADNPVVAELRTLRADMSDMTDRFSKLQVVMDSGRLVGAISAPMDAELGKAAKRYRRGN